MGNVCVCGTMYIHSLHWQLLKNKVLYLWKYYTLISEVFISTQTTIVEHILPLILNIILVHLIFEMPHRKNQTYSHQQNILIATNYGGSLLVTVEK